MEDDLLISRREMIAVLFRRKVSILCIFLSCVSVAAFSVYYLISPSYRADAVLIISTSNLTEPLRDAPPETQFEKLAWFHTQRDILTSERIAAEAVRRTNLAQTRVIGRIEHIGIWVGNVKRRIGEALDIEKWKKPWSAEAAAIAAVHDFLTTSALPDSKAIKVSFRSKDSAEAAKVLNAVLDAHVEYYYGVVREKAAGVIEFLEDDFNRTRESLKEAENALFEFKRRDRVDGSNRARNAQADSKNMPDFSGITDSTKVQEELKLYILKLEEELRIAGQIDDNERRERISSDLKNRLRLYVNAVNSIPARELELVRLKRHYDTVQENYQLLQRNLTRAKLLSGGEAERINLIEMFQRPVENDEVVFPQKRLVMVLAAFLGMVLALTWALVLDYIDHTIRSAPDVTRYLGVRVLASFKKIA